MKIRTEKIIDEWDWNDLVRKTYEKPYHFQQQNDCRDRGLYPLTVPCEDYDSYMNDEIPEIVNGPEEGVKFAVWLARDPKQPLNDKTDDCRADQWAIDLWWERNFYPDIQTIANDLHKRGLLEAGEYMINIDW